jgi:hypothetical protein
MSVNKCVNIVCVSTISSYHFDLKMVLFIFLWVCLMQTVCVMKLKIECKCQKIADPVLGTYIA